MTKRNVPAPGGQIVFASSNSVWGGSEELWSRTALFLAQAGHAIAVFKPDFEDTDKPIRQLREAGVSVIDLWGPRIVPRRLRMLVSMVGKLSRGMMEWQLGRAFRRNPPRLVVISQGINFDGWPLAAICSRRGIRYIMISQKASDLYWPSDAHLGRAAAAHRNACATLFVSQHNLNLTQEQIGELLPRGRVVRNPFNASLDTVPHAWPASDRGFRLACLARLDAREKGQDLLLRVLAQDKWKERPLSVTCYGAGHNEAGLKAMARYLNVESVTFAGSTPDPSSIWADHHALVLASRCEGLPLSMIEAMLHARPVIVTDAGGNREAVRDGETGFLAGAATEQALDEALERAWQARDQWEEMGRSGVALARDLVPRDPVAELAEIILVEACGTTTRAEDQPAQFDGAGR